MNPRAVVDERILKCYMLKIQGKTKRDIVKFCMKTYDVCEKTAYNYIERASDFQNEDAAEYRKEALENQIAALRHLYQRNYREEDWKECRAILQQLSSLLGVEAPTKTELTIKPPIEWVKADGSKVK
jgi:hypothetical protein